MYGIRKRFAESRAQIVNALELPKDATLGEAVVTLIGNNEILIGNYKGLIEYKTHFMRVMTNKGVVELQGSDLTISYLTKDEIRVTGNIRGWEIVR